MRKLTWFVLVLVVTGSCEKASQEPVKVYTSIDGIWTYTTPDKSIRVEFELKTNSSGVVELLAPTIEVDEVPGAAAGMLTNVDVPAIEQIRINANDAGLVFPYYIEFENCSANSTYTLISVADVSYSFPWGQVKTLSGVSITRKGI